MKQFTLNYFKRLVLMLLAVVGFTTTSYAQDGGNTPGAGPVNPVLSTADAPVWYLMKSSHQTEATRQNRYMYWNSDQNKLMNEQHNDGMNSENITNAYRWRLEDAGDGNVYIINAETGLKIEVPADATATNSTPLVLGETGATWTMALSSTVSIDVYDQDKSYQYCFDYVEYGGTEAAYLNATAGSDQPERENTITIYSGGVHNASGWFFYEAGPATYTVEWATDPAEGTLAVSYTDADNETVTVESGKTEIPENTELTVTVTTEDGYSLKSLSYTVGEDGTPVVLEEAPYTFKLTGNTTLSAEFEQEGPKAYNLSWIITGKQNGWGSCSIRTEEGVILDYQEGYYAAGGDLTSAKILSGTTVTVTTSINEKKVSDIECRVYLGDKELELTDGVCSFEMPGEDVALSINFDDIKYDYTVNKTGEGSVVIKSGSAEYSAESGQLNKNAEFEVVATPASGYTVASLEVTVGGAAAEPVDGKYTATGDVVVTVVFEEETVVEPVTYTVTWTTDPAEGTLAVSYTDADDKTVTVESGKTEIPENTELTVTVTTEDGYSLKSLSYTVGEDGTPVVLEEEPYTFKLTGNTILSAVFEKDAVERVFSPIRIPASENNQHYQFRFDDIDLGSHDHGSYTDDTRSRNITMSAWIKLNSTNGQVMGYGQKQYWNCDGTFSLRLENGVYVLKNRSRTGEDGTVGTDTDAVTTQQGETDKWAFVTVVYDDTNKKRYFYYNGNCLVDEAIANLGLGILNDESVFYVSNNDLSLDLDEVQVWNKALTKDEVVSSMTSVNGDEEGLIYLYRFTEKNDDYTYNNMVGESTTTASLVKGTYENVWPNTYTASTVEAKSVYEITWATPDQAQGTLVVKNGNDVLTSPATVLEGTTLTVEAAAEQGYKLTALTYTVGSGEAQDIMESKSFKVTGNTEIAAEFAELAKYTVTWTTDPAEGTLAVSYTDAANETVTVESGKTEIPENTELTVTVTPEDGYSLKSLSYTVGEGGTPVALDKAPYTFELTGNTTLTAEFEKDAEEPVTYTVTWTTDPAEGTLAVSYTDAANETVTVVSGKTEVPANAELTVTVTPAAGYKLTALTYTVDGSDDAQDIMESKSFKVTGDTEIAAVFEKDGSSINSLSADGIYYNAAEEVLYTASAAMVKVYDLSGRLVLNAENQETVSVAGLADGIYTAVVDGKVLKFNK